MRVGRDYRALGRESDQYIVWFWIGSHSDYDKLVSGTGSDSLREAQGIWAANELSKVIGIIPAGTDLDTVRFEHLRQKHQSHS